MRISTLLLAMTLAAPAALTAQQTVSTGAGYADEVYYDLETGTAVKSPLNSWDIGFQVTGFASSIITNGGNNVQLYAVPEKAAKDFGSAVDTAGLSAGWTPWYNSTGTWDMGAFTMDADPGNGDFGWGTYSMINHTVSGTTLYVIVLPNGTAKQIVISGLASGVYTFKYADLDGSNQMTATLDKKTAAGKNFLYYSIGNGTIVDREPQTEAWDLLFGKYIDFAGPNLDIPYGVTGVRSNAGVLVADVTTATPATEPAPAEEAYSDVINTIGYDWKSFSGGSYVIRPDQVFFVRTRESAIYRVIFTGFGGSATGNFDFTSQALGVSSVESEGAVAASLAIYPNVVDRDAQLSCVYTIERPAGAARLSVVDPAGRVVLERGLDASSGMHVEPVRIDAPAGLYMVVLNIDGKQTNRRLMLR